MKYKTKTILIVFVILFAGIISCSSLILVSKTSITDMIPIAPKTGANSGRQGSDLKITGTVPVVAGEDALNEIIKKKVSAGIKTFQNIASQSADTTNFSYDLSYRVGRHDAEYVSILTDAQWYVGGAHGEQELRTFNWKVSEKRTLAFKEILDLSGFSNISELSKYVKKELNLKINSKDTYWKEMIEEGAAPNENNFKLFFIEKNGITFYFQKYQVAPGSEGVQSVKIYR